MAYSSKLFTRRRAIASASALAAGAAFAAYLWWQADTGAVALTERPLIPVRTAMVEQRAEMPMLHRSPGDVRSLRSVDVRSQVDGVLNQIVAQEGMTVKAGDVLARIDDRLIVSALAQARAQHAMAAAQLRVARLDLARYRSLRKEEAVSAQVLEQQAARVSELDASARNLEAAVQTQQVLLSHTEIRSPLNGRVGIQMLHAGNVLRSAEAQVLFTIVQMDPISVEISLPQALLPRIREALAGASPVPVQAYASDGGELLAQGRLALVDNQVSTVSGTVRLKALFDNPQGRLWPGQSVVATVALQVMNDVQVVPTRAVQRGEDGRFVWRVDDATTHPVPVQVLYGTDAWTAVAGVDQGASVVVDGASRLYPGARVRAEAVDSAAGESRMAAAGKSKAGGDATR